MITPAQLRAARGFLDWTRADIAKAANVSPETIKNIEHGTFRPQEATADAISDAFTSRGVQFIGAFLVAYFDRETIKHYLVMLHRIGIPIPPEIRKTVFTDREAFVLNLVSPEAAAAEEADREVAAFGGEEPGAGADDEKTLGARAKADHDAK